MATTTELRIHAAPAVPCVSCGAPLPVDPTAHTVWCPSCRRWNPVPNEVRARAYEHIRATEALSAEQAAQYAQAEAHRVAARKSQGQGRFLLLHAAVMGASGVFGVAVYVVVGAVGVLGSLSEEYEPWAVVLIAFAGGTALLLGIGVIGGGGYALYRLFTRHERMAKKRRSDEWFGGEQGSAGAVCGECGAPVAFRLGEMAVTCGFCRTVVVATEKHARRLISVALGQAQVARLTQAKAERLKIKAELTQRRRQMAYTAYMAVGSLALVALPVLLALYVWRTLTPSIEEAMVALAARLRGEFGAGNDPAYEWLDVYWIGDTPTPLRDTGPFQSRWSVEAVFHDRPVLISATTSWSDLSAKRLVLLLARPREREKRRLEHSEAAARVRARGFELIADYAGVGFERMNVPQREIDDALLTLLALAAYELAEQR